VRLFGVAAILLCGAVAAAAAPSTPKVRLVSAAWNGSWADGYSHDGGVGVGGRYVVFTSGARNIVRSHKIGVFLRDVRRQKSRWLVRGDVFMAALTPDARKAIFCTPEPLARGDVKLPSEPWSRYGDVYVYDIRRRTLRWASIPRSGRSLRKPYPACGGWQGAFEGDFNYSAPAITPNGRFVVFGSKTAGIVPRDKNRAHDVFVRDLARRRTERVSVSSSGVEGNGDSHASIVPAISPNGRYVYFCSSSTNLAPPREGPLGGYFVRDRRTRTTRRFYFTKDGRRLLRQDCPAAVSAEGRYVAFTTQTPELVGDLENAQTQRASQLVVHDRGTGAYDVITRGIDGKGADHPIETVCLSADGRYVAFVTLASNITDGDHGEDADVFWFDRRSRKTIRVSLRADGTEPSGQTGNVLYSLSPDGHWATWGSIDPDVVLHEPRRPTGQETTDVFITGPLR
jgi:hypothetical protein